TLASARRRRMAAKRIFPSGTGIDSDEVDLEAARERRARIGIGDEIRVTIPDREVGEDIHVFVYRIGLPPDLAPVEGPRDGLPVPVQPVDVKAIGNADDTLDPGVGIAAAIGPRNADMDVVGPDTGGLEYIDLGRPNHTLGQQPESGKEALAERQPSAHLVIAIGAPEGQLGGDT